MRRIILYGLATTFLGSVLAAQPVPARDLWQLPLGAVFEPAAIASEAGAGLWNPASIRIPSTSRYRIGVAALPSSSGQGVDGQLIAVAVRHSSGVTFGLSLARSGVSDIVRTESDPTQVSGDVEYSSILVSATAARQIIPHLTLGASARWRQGRTEQSIQSAVAADLGIIVDSLPFHATRLALSSFLWRPGQERNDQPTFLASIDTRVFSRSTLPDLRGGVSYASTYHGEREFGPFASIQLGRLEARATYLQTHAYLARSQRLRSGVALHYASYVIGVGREEGVNGLGALYQFSLSSLLK